MKSIITVLVIFFSTSSFSSAMKREGNCAGKLANGSPIAFQYYSSFDGCKNSAKAAISFDHGRDGMVTGKRSLSERSDSYAFGKIALVFANSTGNTSGKYRYIDRRGDKRSVTLQCDVRDYEYGECH